MKCTDVKKRNLVEKFGLVRFLGGFEGPRYTKKFRSKEFFFLVRTKAHISIILTEMVLEHPKQQLQVSSRNFLK